MPDYALALYGSVLGGSPVPWGDITDKAKNWQRSICANGGAWDGSFRVEAPLYELQDWFYNRLGWHVAEVAGGITWAGMIYEMELTYQGSTRRKSLDDVYNYVEAWYGDGTLMTGQATDADSIAKYGQKEYRLSLTNFPQTAAETQRDLFLREHATAWPRPLTASATAGENFLEVTVLGYWKTMDWRYSPIQDPADADVSTYMTDILNAACTDYLTIGAISANTIEVTQQTEQDERTWTTLKRLTDLGWSWGGTAYPTRLYVDNYRRVFYRQVDTSPIYAIRDDGIYPYSGGAKMSPRQVVPGVVRDMRYPVARVEAGSWLSDARDSWIDRVDVDSEGKLRLSTLEYDPQEIILAQLAMQYEEEARLAAIRAGEEAAADARRDARARQHWSDLTREKENDPDRNRPGYKWTGNDWEETDESYM